MSEISLLVNDQELVDHVVHVMLRRRLRHQCRVQWNSTDAYVTTCLENRRTTGRYSLDFIQLHNCIQQDIDAFQRDVKKQYKKHYRELKDFVRQKLPSLTATRDQVLIKITQDSHDHGMVRIFGKHLGDQIRAISIRQYHGTNDNILIRNIINNEDILKDRVAQKKPFWFMDTGYTNHLTGRKTWHRVVRNYMHMVPDLSRSWPADRLNLLQSFPLPWHGKGSRVLIVESSHSHYRLYDDDIQHWRNRMTSELDTYDNRLERVFYPKEDRKTRTSVWELLKQDPRSWYCVISDCSAAAIEAIWLGIPVITLRPHITTPVSRNSIDQIHDLYRGPIGDWLCAVTYSQFSVDELHSGRAWKILRKYHGA